MFIRKVLGWGSWWKANKWGKKGVCVWGGGGVKNKNCRDWASEQFGHPTGLQEKVSNAF